MCLLFWVRQRQFRVKTVAACSLATGEVRTHHVDRSHFVLNVRVGARMVHWRSMDQNTRDILEAVNFIKEKVEQLPTKDDVRAIVEEVLDEKLRPIHASLSEINRRLDTIEEHYGNLKGVTKEIDEIRAEVHEIQKHLGIEKKIAA